MARRAFQLELPLDGFCCGPMFRPVVKIRPPVRSKGKEGVVHRAQTRRATPVWSDREAVKKFYDEAKRLTRETGELHVVDHIVPKISKWVCGLHVPANLEVIHWLPNAIKSNAHWPGAWMEQQELL